MPIQSSKTLSNNFKKTTKFTNLFKKFGVTDSCSPINTNLQFPNLRSSMKNNDNNLTMKQVNFANFGVHKKSAFTPEKSFLSKDIHHQNESEYNRISSVDITDNSNKPLENISILTSKKIGKNSNAINKLKINTPPSIVSKNSKKFFRPSLKNFNKQNSIYQNNNNFPQTPLTKYKTPLFIENNNNFLKRHTGKNIQPFSLNNTNQSKNISIAKSIVDTYRKLSIYYNGTSRSSFISNTTNEENILFNNINAVKTAVFGNHENLKEVNSEFVKSTKIAIDHKEFEKLEKINKKIIKSYFICSFFCVLSIACSCYDVEEYIEKSINYTNEKFLNNNDQEIIKVDQLELRKLSFEENLVRILNGIFSLLSVGALIFSHIIKNKAIKKNILSKNKKSKEIKMTLFDIFFKKDNKIILIVEGIICIFFYPPFINEVFYGKYCETIYVVPLNTIFYFLCCLKIIPIIAFYKRYSKYNSVYSKKIFHDKGIKMHRNFIFRSTYSKYPLLSSICCILIFIFLSDFLILSFEAFFYNNKNENYNNLNEHRLTYNLVRLVYISLKQFPKVLTPITPLGKIFLYILGIFGSAFVCFLLRYLNGLFDFNPQEQKAYSKLQKLFNPENKIYKAANLIKLIILKKKLLVDFEKKKLNEKDFFNEKKCINFLREKNKFYLHKFVLTIKTSIHSKNFMNEFKIASNYSLPLDDILITFQNRMLENLANANNRVDVYLDMHTILKNVEKNNQKFIESIINSNKIQNEVIKFLFNYYGELISQKKKRKKKINTVEKSYNQNFDKFSDKCSRKRRKKKLPFLENIEDEDKQQTYSLKKLPRVKKKDSDLILTIKVIDDD